MRQIRIKTTIMEPRMKKRLGSIFTFRVVVALLWIALGFNLESQGYVTAGIVCEALASFILLQSPKIEQKEVKYYSYSNCVFEDTQEARSSNGEH
jgi:hypothetical protein